jgi:hypothetical protein
MAADTTPIRRQARRREAEGWQSVNPSCHSVLLRLTSNDCRQSGILSAFAERSGTMLASRANESRKRLMTGDGTLIAVLDV